MLKPRALIAQVWPSKRATCTPVASRSASGRVVMPARRMSSPVMTWMAAAASLTGSACFIAVVTSMRDSSSMESRLERRLLPGPRGAGLEERRTRGRQTSIGRRVCNRFI